MRFHKLWFVRLSVLSVFVAGIAIWKYVDHLSADEPAKTAAAKKTEEKPEDPFALPEAKTPETLLKFISGLQQRDPVGESDEEIVADFTKQQNAIIKASEELLAVESLSEDNAIAGIQAKVMAYSYLTRLGDETGLQKALKFVESYTGDKRPKVAEFASEIFLQIKIAVIGTLEPKERQALIDGIVAEIEKTGPTRFNLGPLFQIAQQMESALEPAEAAANLRRFATLLSKAKDEEIAALGKKFEGTARRLELPGKPMEVFGTTLDGKPFNWKSYRGKVVLVDYWATWCGPCIQELPNVKENYEKYHSKGFEVVAINLDDEKESVEAFLKAKEIPWVNLFPEKEMERGWNNPMAEYYGINGIPTAILVDQQGNVVSLEARGEELGAMLEELLGKKPAE